MITVHKNLSKTQPNYIKKEKAIVMATGPIDFCAEAKIPKGPKIVKLTKAEGGKP